MPVEDGEIPFGDSERTIGNNRPAAIPHRRFVILVKVLMNFSSTTSRRYPFDRHHVDDDAVRALR